MKNNKIWITCGILVLCAVFFSGCQRNGRPSARVKTDKLRVVSTIFPPCDWAGEIVGDRADGYELTFLLDQGADLHSYQPTAEDITKIADCDVFIYVGGESDGWVEDALKESGNSERQVINLLDVLGDTVKEEEIVTGMEAEEECEAYDEPEYDEHVWLSLKNAQILVRAIGHALETVDSSHAKTYQESGDRYVSELKALDREYKTMTDSAKRKTVLFGDRFPFRYLMDDYGITYYAAFAGCSAESEASFETIAFLTGTINELQLPSVLVIEKSDDKIAQAIKANTLSKDQKILVMNSLQSVTREEADQGFTYLSAMKENLATLKQALN